MKLQSVETTPNPHSMKLNLDGSFASAVTYSADHQENCPQFIASILLIPGVKSVFACSNFITVNKDAKTDWRPILNSATDLLGGEQAANTFASPQAENQANDTALQNQAINSREIDRQREAAQREGQVQILVQTFRGIPIQVKAVEAQREMRISLGERFDLAAQKAQKESGADFLKERYWADHGVRYGPLEEIANEAAEELRCTFDQNRLDNSGNTSISKETLSCWLEEEDWHKRLMAVQILSTTPDCIALLIVALKDAVPQVRRLAAAALGTTGSALAVPALSRAMIEDTAVGVRRTAGDALSDIGDVSAEGDVCKALADPNKLVRWRAARFLSDVGSENALPFLQAAINDKEFEVRLEIEAAIQRISGGGQGMGPAWKRIIEQT